MNDNNRVRVLIVDDSALIRKVLSDILAQDPGIEVVGVAADGTFALRKVEQLNPDVVTMDVEMKQMGGLEALDKLMQIKPLPVIMVSAHTTKGADATFKALELGAIDFVTKPQAGGLGGMNELAAELITKVKLAKNARIRRRGPASHRQAPPPPRPAPMPAAASMGRCDVVAVGASTGGTEALKDFLMQIPADGPPIVIVQHMPENFTRTFAERLDSLSPMKVKEAEHGDPVVRGQALVAPGHSHMEVVRVGGRLLVHLNQDPPVMRHRPSVEVLFRSVARVNKDRAIGIIMTGMGADGAKGMLEMKQAGARTIAQDEQTCVVFGMPKEAIAAGGVDHVVPLPDIASTMFELMTSRTRPKTTVGARG